MRSLKYSMMIIIFLCAHIIMAEPAKFSASHTTSSESGSAPYSSFTNNAFNSTIPREAYQNNLVISTARAHQGFRFETSVQVNKFDYSNYILQDLNGTEHSLARDFNQTESLASFLLDFKKDIHSFGISTTSSISESPLNQNFMNFSYSVNLLSSLASIGLGFGIGNSQQPLNYYTDTFSGKRIELPTEIKSETILIFYEQILTEKIKTLLQFETNTKTGRPRADGIISRTSYALSSKDFVKYELARYQENLKDTVTDQNGYFDLLSSEINYSRYITYDLILTAGYGLTIESQSFPKSTQINQTSTDSYNLNLGYQATTWKIEFKTQQVATNTNYTSSLYGGSIEWVF